jgi:hypothetical protein
MQEADYALSSILIQIITNPILQSKILGGAQPALYILQHHKRSQEQRERKPANQSRRTYSDQRQPDVQFSVTIGD